MCVDPFAWWQTHKSYFLKVVFLAKQIFGILGHQSKMKRNFNVVGVLTTLTLWHCCLQIQNLDEIIIVVKNWLDNFCLNLSLLQTSRITSNVKLI
jgi:hypothetical protein